MQRAVIFALLSAALFGVTTPLAKLVVDDLGPWTTAGLMYLGAGIGLACVRVVRGNGGEAPLVLASLPWLAGAVLTGGIVAPVLLMAGLARSDAASAALLLNLEGLATLALAWLVWRENVDRRLLIGAAAILAGAVVLTWQGGGGLSPGSLLIAAACLAWGIDNNLTRHLSAADPVVIVLVKGLVAGGVNLTIALYVPGADLPSMGQVAGLMILGFLGYGVSLTLFVRALRDLGTARTGAYFATAPFLGAMLALLMAGRWPDSALLVAGALMAVGLWLHLSERHDHDHDHPDLAHDHAHSHDLHHLHDHPPGTDPRAPHSHMHRHGPLTHRHPHTPDLHHRHDHNH